VSTDDTAWAGERRPERAAALLVDARSPRWIRRFGDELDRRLGASDLERVLSVWHLSQSDAARLFGVSRQAVGKWLRSGVPAERAGAVADLGAATDLLVRYLRRERIPAVVRRPAAVTGGRSLLDVAADDAGAALDAVRAMFDFAVVSSGAN
jgi:predicted transcriptional regulator